MKIYIRISSFICVISRDRFDQYWKNHFSTIGLLGMNEACLNLLGQDIATPQGKDFAVRVLEFMRE